MPNQRKLSRTRVFLVDDHRLVRQHLTALIQEEADLEVCGEAEDAPAALALIRQLKPSLIILDLSLKRSHGLDLLADLQGVEPRPAVLVLSMHDETLYAERALRAGALGYITKEGATVNILSAIRRVLSGQVYLSDVMAGQLAGKLARGGRADVEKVLL
jgi:DNA-binding NarL/FixJ family response regulator